MPSFVWILIRKKSLSYAIPIGCVVEPPKLRKRKFLTLSPDRRKVFEIIEIKRDFLDFMLTNVGRIKGSKTIENRNFQFIYELSPNEMHKKLYIFNYFKRQNLKNPFFYKKSFKISLILNFITSAFKWIARVNWTIAQQVAIKLL